LAVLFKYSRVVRLRELARRKPKDVLNGIFDANAANVYPLRRCRELGRVVPKELLSKVEADLVA